MIKLKAFTLAEVLITLAIVGIIAALTIPTLINNHKAVMLKSQLQKAYSLLSQVIDMEYAETGQSMYDTYIDASGFYKALMKHLKVAKDCGANSCVTWEPDVAYVIDAYKIYSKKSSVATHMWDDGQFIVLDGLLVMVENDTSNPWLLITVDVNGLNKAPNAWGHDVFTFELTSRGLLPSGAPGTSKDLEKYPALCSPTSSNGENGIACTYKALNDPDYFKNLPQ